MAILPILIDPDPILRQISKPVEKFDEDLKIFMASLYETMLAEKGLGIAAIQVGNPIRALISDIPFENTKKPIYIINPEIAYLSDAKVILSEGCLSVEDNEHSRPKSEVERPLSIDINYQNLLGEFCELKIDGSQSDYNLWTARCIQHEIDHLNGILFIDKAFQ